MDEKSTSEIILYFNFSPLGNLRVDVWLFIKSNQKNKYSLRTYDVPGFALSPMGGTKKVPGFLKSCRGKLLKTESLNNIIRHK